AVNLHLTGKSSTLILGGKATATPRVRMTDMDKYRVTLTAEERADLEQLVSSGKAAARKLTHARILLLADDSLGEERPDEQIVASLGTSPRTVARVRQHLVTAGVDVAILRRRQPPR